MKITMSKKGDKRGKHLVLSCTNTESLGLPHVIQDNILQGKRVVMETLYEPSPTGIGRRRVKAVVFRFHLDYMERLIYTFPHVEMSPAAERYYRSQSKDIYADLPIPKVRIPGFNGKLWNFQKVGVKWINDHILADEDCCLNDEMGLGKTVQVFAAIARKSYENVLVVTTNSGKWSWRKIASEPTYVNGETVPPMFPELDVQVIDGTKAQRVLQLSEDRQITVVNVEMLRTTIERRRGPEGAVEEPKHAFPQLFNKVWDLIVVDETHKCFLGTTKIITEVGEQTIKSLVDSRYSGNVWTSLGWKPVIDWMKTPLRSHMVKITYDGGELVCTTDHPVWTEEHGYVQACEVRDDDHLRVVLDSASPAIRQGDGQVLQYDVLCQVEDGESSRATRTVSTSDQGGTRSDQRQAESESVSTDEGKQSYAFASYKGEGLRFLGGDWSWPKDERGEWGWTYDPTNIALEPTWQEVDARVRGAYGTARERMAESLHNRLGVAYTEDCCRSGRCFAQGLDATSFRSEEGPILARARVASVEVYESANFGNFADGVAGDSLYNLSVLDAEEYVADGVLVHNCKNPDAQVTKGFLRLQAKRGLYMSGTPFLNRPDELWPVLHRIDPVRWGSQPALIAELVIDLENGQKAYRPDVVKEIKTFLNEYALRRRKDQVVKDLPEEIFTQILVDLNDEQRILYDQIRDEALLALDNGEIKSVTHFLAVVTRLKQACWSPELYEGSPTSAKIEELKKVVKELVESGEKAIIFSQWEKACVILKRELEEYNPAYVTGKIKGAARQAEQDKFNRDEDCKLYIGTIGANQEAITLSAATYIVFTDLSWTPLANAQARARGAGGGLRGAYLIGKDAKINCIELFARGTIEEWIEELLATKKNLFTKFIESDGGMPVTRFQVESLRDLLTR